MRDSEESVLEWRPSIQGTGRPWEHTGDGPGVQHPDEILSGFARAELEEESQPSGASAETDFELLLVDLMHQFATISTEPTEPAIREAQSRICHALNLNCCALFRVAPNGKELAQTQTYTGFGSTPALLSKDESLSTLPKVLAGQTVHLRTGAERADDARTSARPADQREARSVIVLPLLLGQTVVGALGFRTAHCAGRQSTELLQRRLRTIADLFAGLLGRTRAEQQISHLKIDVQRLRDQVQSEHLQSRDDTKVDQRYENIIGKSAALSRVIGQVEQVAGTESIVLLTGETGTGKELIAQLIHDLSPWRGKRMVKVNCAALPAGLVESELFGRERGAYTGALTREIGRFELAHQSTIFLDELGELPIELQAKLLRVLQEGEFERVGNPKPIRVNARVIAATNKNLKQAVADGRFREDLFYRLAVFPIELPPLRERTEDIPMMVWAFVNEFGATMGKTIEAIPEASMAALQEYAWPGNVRELRNVIERAMIITNGPTLHISMPDSSIHAGADANPLNLRDLEKRHILHVLRQTGWRIRGAGRAAELLGLKPTTLEARMAKLGISRAP